MKKLLLLYFLLWIGSPIMTAQNLLPLDWNIHFTDPSSVSSRHISPDTTINLLSSWERQGYFSADKDCLLSTNFEVWDLQCQYNLISHLQCKVFSILINDKIVATNLSNRKEKIHIQIPSNILQKGTNRIVVHCTDLAYTGGISHNSLELRPIDEKIQENIQLEMEVPNHVYQYEDRKITIRSNFQKSAKLQLRLEDDFHTQLLDTCIQLKNKDSIYHIDLTNKTKKAGFYQCTAILQGIGYSGDIQWLAIRPETITCKPRKPSNFESYWTKAEHELQNVSPCFKLLKIDSLSAISTRDVYIMEMQSLNHITIRGYYFVPRTQQQHYAILHLPGYGQGFKDLSSFLSSQTEHIDLALCVRGHGISSDVFCPGFGIPGIWGYQICNHDSIAYRGIYMDCLRAVDFLHSRPEVDKKHIGVMGGSQGGGLAVITAALRPDKIAACAFFDPFPCDIRHQISIRSIWETELKNYLKYYQNQCSYEEVLNLQDLIDIRSFASMIRCHVFFATGLFDDDCPAHGSFSLYNQISSPKQYEVYPQCSHLGEFNYNRLFLNWFDKLFKK